MARVRYLLLLLAAVASCQNTRNPENSVPTKPSNSASTSSPPITNPSTEPLKYWVTFSKTIRPGHPMIIQVQVFKVTAPVDIYIDLLNPSQEIVLHHGPVTVYPNVPKIIRIKIPDNLQAVKMESQFQSYHYAVKISAEGEELSFTRKGYVELKPKAFSVFIQTDKAMYKPSQKVQFRTLVMTPDMKVLKDVEQDIVVKDSKGNSIAQYKGINAPQNLGVVQRSFQLADSVPVGDWSIQVTVKGVDEIKTFEVSDYVLPKFEVQIDAPPYGLTSDRDYSFTVKAKYTFGKPVTEGAATVLISKSWYNNGKVLKKQGKLNKDGEVKFAIPLAELAKFFQRDADYVENIAYQTYDIHAEVLEARTQNVQKAEKFEGLRFFSTPIDMKFLDITPSSFKSGLNFTAYLEVTKKDGQSLSALETKDIRVQINVTYHSPVKKVNEVDEDGIDVELYPGRVRHPTILDMKTNFLTSEVHVLPESGWLVINFTVPNTAQRIMMSASTISPYSKEVKDYHTASKFTSPTSSFLQLRVMNEKPMAGEILKVLANSTKKMKLLNYQVYSKGNLLLTKEVKIEENASKSVEFEFELTRAMSPSMTLIAFYLEGDREFVVDALSLSVDGIFNNAVSVEFGKKKVQPGEDVDVIVKGEKGSVVFLLAVDKSVKLLKSGNDITQELVREELTKYDYGNYGHWRYMFFCGWPHYPAGTNAASVFRNSGVVVITDGQLDSHDNHGGFKTRVPSISNGDILSLSNGGDKETSVGRNDFLTTTLRTRKRFLENWLWQISTITPDSDGEVVITLTAPDTITSWVASVFSVNPRSGLSVASAPAEVTTFQNMFISLDLPSSIIRNEHFCFLASVFSYYPEEIPVMLTLEQSPDFSVVMAKEADGTVIPATEKLSLSYFLGFLKENAVKSVTYCFTPETIGLVPLRLSSLTNVDGLNDAIERHILVKPEGVPRATSISNLVTLENGEWSKNLNISFPPDTVDGSEYISINIAGNLIGPVFDNLEDLLKKPYGCGEQNMINFAPIMSLLDFFFTTGTITEEFREKAVEYMRIGYQKEILYEHGKTGGYSTFGNNENTEENASTWLTAFVTKCFAQAEQLNLNFKDVLSIDTELILRSTNWMLEQQLRDGSFVENGRVFNKNLQGGSAKGIALTSYTVIALHTALEVLNEYTDRREDLNMIQTRLNRGVAFLEMNLADLEDPYDVCITTYALHLVNSKKRHQAFEMMSSMAKSGDGLKYWERPSQEKKRDSYWWSQQADAINIEMTSYALLTYNLRNEVFSGGLSIVRWLSLQKGPNGGFISTQDTVIGIEALTTVAKKLFDVEFVPMTIEVVSGNDKTRFSVTKENEMNLQKKKIAYQAGGKIELKAKAVDGVENSISPVLVDVVFKYNVLSGTKPIVYDMEHKVRKSEAGYELHVNIWTVDEKPASMSILEIELPAGYSSDLKTLKESNDYISKVDIKDGYLNIYINTDVIDGEGVSFKVPIDSNGGVLMKTKGKSIKVYDYYEPEIELTKEYFLTEEGDLCDNVPDLGICQVRVLENASGEM